LTFILIYAHNVRMVRKTFYILRDQLDLLRTFPDASVSEHIRRAIDNYIRIYLQKKRTLIKNMFVVSPSRKGGGHGRKTGK